MCLEDFSRPRDDELDHGTNRVLYLTLYIALDMVGARSVRIIKHTHTHSPPGAFAFSAMLSSSCIVNTSARPLQNVFDIKPERGEAGWSGYRSLRNTSFSQSTKRSTRKWNRWFETWFYVLYRNLYKTDRVQKGRLWKKRLCNPQSPSKFIMTVASYPASFHPSPKVLLQEFLLSSIDPYPLYNNIASLILTSRISLCNCYIIKKPQTFCGDQATWWIIIGRQLTPT